MLTRKFLSLSRGDKEAQDLLQRAVSARYGLRPVMIESLRLTMSGKSKGLFGLPVKVQVHSAYVGMTHWRWEQSSKLLGLTTAKTIESFDAGAYYRAERGRVQAFQDPRIVESYRRRIWAMQALFLTPLTQDGAILKVAGDRAFQAIPEAHPEDVATVYLHPDFTVAAIEIERFRPMDERRLPYMLRPEGGLVTLNELVLPAQITYQWGGGEPVTYSVVGTEVNPVIPLTEFTMQAS